MRTENSSAVDRKSQLEIRKYGGLTGLEPVTLISIMPASGSEGGFIGVRSAPTIISWPDAN
jgi:hypothetical protein